jgi:hypothetical protein
VEWVKQHRAVICSGIFSNNFAKVYKAIFMWPTIPEGLSN